MKLIKICLVLLFIFIAFSNAQAVMGVIASDDDISRLKNDLLNGKLVVGKTRLKQVRNEYGEAPSISDSETKVVYNYGDLRVEFNKIKYWKDWTTDGTKDAVYTDDVDDLRYDLDSEELVGNEITKKMIFKDYGVPTLAEETDEDGGTSVYYYGQIKMIFENYTVLRSWKGQNLEGVVSSSSSEEKKEELIK